MIIITSLQNEQVKYVVSLHKNKGRKESGRYIIEGKRFVEEAFLRKAEIERIYFSGVKARPESYLIDKAQAKRIPVEEADPKVLKKMCTTEEPQGILAVIKKKVFSWQDISLDKNSILLVIDRIKDPGNLGTIMRTALAAGVNQICIIDGTVDVYNPKALRSSMGAIFSSVIIDGLSSEEIVNFSRKSGLCLIVSTKDGKSVYANNVSTNYPMAFIVGNEADGVSNYFLEKADLELAIPMFNRVESLNAAMAAGIFLYEFRRQVEFL